MGTMIHWNASPELLSIGSFSVRWYGLFFALSFVLGLKVVERIFAAEKIPEQHLDRLFVLMVLGTIAGARLGHCLFYEPEVYLADPLRILMVWEGGLASHGAAVGIFTLLWYYCRKHKMSWLWLADRLCLTVALAGGFIRLGNLFNSEILGKATSLPWAFVFDRINGIPRHPTQIYESLTYFATFFFLLHAYWKRGKGEVRGYLLGWFLVLVFGSRIVWEFFKENQVAFEAGLPLNMGQILSLPLMAAGLFLILRGNPKRTS